jgi:hypothetical protein
MGLTSCRWMTIAKTLAPPATRCRTGIMPNTVSLSNAPPTATPLICDGPLRGWLTGHLSLAVGQLDHEGACGALGARVQQNGPCTWQPQR